ncbi:MAG: sugar ABC transporter permease [Oscillospiraceae bacterium]|nr:sugar ABC transporter permease [Oscillospiraceae bacterium]
MAAPLTRRKSISYSKWGYFFIAPFFIVYAIFSLVPLVSTFYNSLFENYMDGLNQVGPNFVGLANFEKVLASDGDLMKYVVNTFVIWIIGFVPQIFFSLLLASWFTDLRLKLKATGFFKVVIYLPNVIMAAAISMLFFAIFSDIGPINSMLVNSGALAEPYSFFDHEISTRLIIAGINFLLWYGNTTIMLMASIMGIDPSLFESADIDGANPTQTFWKITIPLIRPLLLYTLITSLIGGLQMFDIPNIITNKQGSPNRTSMTLVMYLNNHLFSKNYGMGGAVSVVLFVVGAILSIVVFYIMRDKDAPKNKIKKKKGANLL